jgi:glycosyltransferase involved in cell wall biosynthesis
VKEKGFDELILLMRDLPEADLLIAGTGPHESALRTAAASAPNVHFVGLLGESDLFRLYKGARALAVPSKFWETFGYVALEAFAVGTPAIVRDCGALPELIRESGAGDVYRSNTELRALLRQYLADADYAKARGRNGQDAQQAQWSEAEHVGRYLQLIERARSSHTLANTA